MKSEPPSEEKEPAHLGNTRSFAVKRAKKFRDDYRRVWSQGTGFKRWEGSRACLCDTLEVIQERESFLDLYGSEVHGRI